MIAVAKWIWFSCPESEIWVKVNCAKWNDCAEVWDANGTFRVAGARVDDIHHGGIIRAETAVSAESRLKPGSSGVQPFKKDRNVVSQ